MGDSAFRRLLLDTVSTVIAQPPSTASLIDLLRIATPSLLASISSSKQQQDDAHAIVRDASQREKLFRTLQLRIHPDKHSGEERATALFQDVTTFYGKCVDAMERDGTRRWGTDVSGTRATTSSNDNPSTTASGSKTNQNRWHPPSPPQYPRGSTSTTASSSSTPHSDYVRSDYQYGQRQQVHASTNPRRKKTTSMSPTTTTGSRRQPSSHQCCAVISTILFPPLGLCALLHSLQVRKAWNDGRFGDARDHADQAKCYAWFGCLCFGCLIVYLCVSGGDGDWNWDHVKHNFPWNDGP